jgi:hypothetical protein
MRSESKRREEHREIKMTERECIVLGMAMMGVRIGRGPDMDP